MISNTELQSQERELAASIEIASDIITKNYLGELEQYVISPPSLEDLDIDVTESGQFYHISKLVFNKDEHFLDKLTTIINVAFSVDGSIVSMIKSDGKYVDYYIGIISKKNRAMNEVSLRKREAAAAAFHGAIQGNLIGSAVAILSESEVKTLQESTFAKPDQAVSSVSGIVSLRGGNEKDVMAYVQGIENLVDSLKNQAYTIVLVADPINSGELQSIKQGYELLYSQLVSYWKSSLTMNENESISLSQAYTNGVTTGITKGISLTQSKTKGTNKSAGMSVGLNVGIPIPVGFIGGSIGVNGSFGSSQSETSGEARSFNESEQVNRSSSNSTSTTHSEGKSIQLNYENRSIKALIDKIDKQLERLEFCESFGAFDCAAYIIADNRNIALTVSSNYNALMRGEDSSIQASYINTWHKKQDVETLLTYLNSFVHPRFFDKTHQETAEKLLVTPASIINGKEMAIQIGLPKKSVSGISVIPMAPFGRNVRKVEEACALKLGELYHMGKPDSAVVELDVQSLASHTFVTGSTGSGKSNTIYHLLSKLDDKDIPFLVVEPVKGEYKHIFGNRDDVNVFGTNPAMATLLRLNPFSFPDGIHVLEHIDRLIEIFNVCWSMYAAMPAVLKEAIEDAYVNSGWDLMDSINENCSDCFPTFIDVMESLQKVISQSAYSDELKSNYKGSLLTRVKSLTNGLNGLMLCNGELSDAELFDQRTIVDLHRVGSDETRSLIMGLLVMRLQEYRMTQGGINQALKHVTVLEEAHHLLKRISTEQSMESSNVQGKSVEMLTNAIAEMRTYGEGFIIADQSPVKLDSSVIRNTNTKIILRMPDLNDRQLVGLSASLNDEQIVELAKLSTGVAAVYQNNWLEPVLCKMEPYYAGEQLYKYDPSAEKKGEAAKLWRKQLVSLLVNGQQIEPLEVDVDGLARGLPASALSTKNKLAIADLLTEFKQTKKLELWERKHIIRLSTLVSALIDERRIVDQILELNQETERLNDELSSLVRRSLGRTGDKLTLIVCQCLLIDKAEQKEEWQRLYYKWDYHIKNRNLI